MEKWSLEALIELKQYFVNMKWIDGLFQILYVLDDVKPGVWLQLKTSTREEILFNMLYWFELYVSKRHGGYATKDKSMYRNWNKIFGFRLDAESFLGYPKCCVENHHSKLSGLLFFIDIYALMKRVRYNKTSPQQFKNIIFSNFILLHHIPCRLTCRSSYNMGMDFYKTIQKYHWLTSDLLPTYKLRKIEGLFQVLKYLPSRISSIDDNSAFIEKGVYNSDCLDILNNTDSFYQNFHYGRDLLLKLVINDNNN